MLNHEYPPIGGGSGIAMKYLAESLVAIGHNVLVLTVFDREQVYEEAGVRLWRFPIAMRSGKLAGFTSWVSFLPRASRYLHRIALDFKPHVINSHFVFPSGYVVARVGLNIPHITSVVGADIHDPTRKVSADCNLLVRWLVRQAVRHATLTTTPSNDLTRRTTDLFPDAEVQTIPWGVPGLKPNGCSRSQLGLPKDAFVISTVCRLVRRKRLDLLLDSVAQLRQRRVLVLILGFGPEEQALREYAHKLEIPDQILFAGRVSEQEKANYLANSDIFCLPSEHEGFGLAFIEAMSVGTPVIAANVGGQNDIIRNGHDGFLVPVGDARTLCDRIRLLFDNPTLLTEFSEKAQQRAQKFQPTATADAFSKVYAKAVSMSILNSGTAPARYL